MCCLKYEQEAYEYLNKLTPRAGSLVRTREGEGIVLDANPLSGMLQVKVGEDGIPFSVHRDDVKFIRHSKGRSKAKGGKGRSGGITEFLKNLRRKKCRTVRHLKIQVG